MTENTWPDPARPGVPLNPEKDGWHWVEYRFSGDRRALMWLHDLHWGLGSKILGVGKVYIYLGPVLTPEEIAAKDARIAELEAQLNTLRNNKTEEEALRKMMRDPRYWRHRDPEWVNRVRDGFGKLLGGKDG